MSSYTFSYQFYQHWTHTPEPVRTAIIQELTDITDLLQTDTPFESFIFSTHDLDAHLDALYHAHELQLEHELQQEEEPVKASHTDPHTEKMSSSDVETVVDNALDSALDNIKAPAVESDVPKDTPKKDITDHTLTILHHSDGGEVNSTEIDGTEIDSTDTDDTLIVDSIQVMNTPEQGATTDLLPVKYKLNTDKQAFIHELEMRIDDQLTEQMLHISEELKSWLRTEINSQLASKDLTADKTDNSP